MRWWYTIVTLAAFSLFVACGGDDKREQAISETVEGFFLAMGEDPPKAYTYLSQECKSRVSFLEFAAGLSSFEGFVGESELQVTDLEIVNRDGDELTALFEVILLADGEDVPLTQGLGDEGPTRFLKEDGRWRFGDCGIYGGDEDFGEIEVDPPPPPEQDPPSPRILVAQAAEADSGSDLPGEYIDLPGIYGGPYPDTAAHVTRAIDYAAEQDGLPPAGGPHWGSGACPLDPDDAPPFCGPVPGGFYVEAWPAASLVHNMEHGATIVWYNTNDQDIIDDLADFGSDNSGPNPFLVVTPFPEMEDETVAITTWSRRLKVSTDDYDRELLQEFFDANNCRFDPEAFCAS